MRIKLTLRGRGPSDIDLVVTADSTATVGDIAATLATAGPEGAAPARDPESLTLRLLDPVGGRVTSVLSSTSYVTETGLRSGALVDIVGAEQASSTGVAAAELRVVGGPDKGRRIALSFGATILGRSAKCGATLNDPMVSKQHARITVGSGVEIHDLNSANGVVIGEQRVERARVNPGDLLTIGGSTVQIVQLRAPEVGSADSTDIAFVRPPQVIPHVAVKKFKLPQAPGRGTPVRFPILALIAPVLMGVVSLVLTRNAASLMFVLLSPVMMLGSWVDQKRQNKRQLKEAKSEFEEAIAVLRADLEAYRKVERETRHAQYPPVKQIVDGAIRRDGSLWLRRPEHPEFLCLRIGTGTAPAGVELENREQAKGLPEYIKQVREIESEFSTIKAVPIVADLHSIGGLGLCGKGEKLPQVQAAIAAQIAAQYSPAEVTIVCLTSTRRIQNWKWLAWLPHVSSSHSPLGSALHLSADVRSGGYVLAALEGLLEARSGGTSGQGAPTERGPLGIRENAVDKDGCAGAIPAVVVFVDDTEVDRARLNRLLELGPDVGIFFVWSSEEYAELPAGCRTFIALGHEEAVVGEVRSSRVVQNVTIDAISLEEVASFARILSPIVDAGIPVDDSSDLPGSISYVSLCGRELADNPEAVIEQWHGSGSIKDRSQASVKRQGNPISLAALVGQGAEGPLQLDLRTQGPHALVGGTTGAGKSEFLQAWVLAMAQAVSPDRLTFLFVDYKGGSAFARCTELPHCVGLVTDLSPYLVRRALTSLRAELHFREKLLNAKSAKDLATLEKTGDPDCPPSLVIVIDEFAALVNEVPEFVDGVVDVAQRGRSLGLHLILATQRPAGVIKDNLRANTNLRVALRMADTDDSQDVLSDQMAAHFPQNSPGRAASKTGPGRLSVFQSAYPGAKTAEDGKTANIEIEELGFGESKRWRTPELPKPDESVPADIDRVVTTMRQAASLAKIPAPRKPWLPDLAPAYDIAKLHQREDSALVLGVIDVPENQDQAPEYFYPDQEGNIAYFGASGAGKTTALRSLAIVSAITPRTGPIHVYGLDFSGGGLEMLKVMPHVGDIIMGDDEERVFRLIQSLTEIVEERAARYSGVHAANLTNYRRISGLAQEPRILLLVDGLGTFSDNYQTTGRLLRLWGQFQQILLDGRAVGVHVAVSVDRPQSMPSSLASSFQRKVVLRMTDEDQYLYFGLPKDVLGQTSLPGRAMQVGKPNIMQIAILGDNINALAQARAIERMADSKELQSREKPKPIRALPNDIAGDMVPKVVAGKPVVGVEAESLSALTLPSSGVISVAGQSQSGRSNALWWLAESIRQAYSDSVLLHACARRSHLSRLPLWTESAQGLDAITEMLERYSRLFEREALAGQPNVVLFVENVAEYSYSVCEGALLEAIHGAKYNGQLAIVEGETSDWGYGGQITTALRTARTGLVLCPNQGDGENVVSLALPGLFGKEFTPGRGYFVQGSKMWKVQVPRM